MKFSLNTLACPAWNLDQIIAAASGSGLDGIDFRGMAEAIDITHLPEFTTDLSATVEKLKAAKLGMPCLNTSVTLVCQAPAQWDEMLEEFHRYAQLAAATATPIIRVFGGATPKELSPEQARSMAERHLRQLAKIGRPFNCRPAVETHDAWGRARLLELLHEFDPRDAGIIWDVEHTTHDGDDPLETVQSLKKYLAHAQFKDVVMEAGQRKPQLLGHGHLPLRAAFNALRSIDYAGWICLETEKRWDSNAPDPEFSVPQFAGFMRGLMAA